MNQGRYSNEEKKLLKEYFKTNMSIKDIAKKMNRSEKSIETQFGKILFDIHMENKNDKKAFYDSVKHRYSNIALVNKILENQNEVLEAKKIINYSVFEITEKNVSSKELVDLLNMFHDKINSLQKMNSIFEARIETLEKEISILKSKD